jgi:hypothetical protein
MSLAILSDAQVKPRLYRWYGPIDRQHLLDWSARLGWALPADLIEFWTVTGGGQVFETEEFPRPLSRSNDQDSVEVVTQLCRRQGMPAGLVVVHEGLGRTVVRCEDGAYLSLGDDFVIAARFESFNDWYSQVLRAEYWERYGLPPM